MEIRPIDPWDDAVMTRYYAITRDASLHGRPDAPMWSESDITLMFRQDDPAEKLVAYGVFDGDEMTGAGLLALPQLDNTEKAWIEALVEPSRRRRGIGSAIVGHLVEEARQAGRTVVISESFYPFERREDHPYRRFAEKNGFRISITEIRRDLALPIDESVLQEWVDESRPHHPDYRIATFERDLPPELLDSFLDVMNQIAADMPGGDTEWERENVDPETWAQKVRNADEAGRRDYHTVAISPSDEVVAYSTLVVPAEDMPTIHQWGTLVRADHRGKRLGLAVKATNLRHVQARHPERTRVTTTNAEVNAQMVDINERMGFRAVEINVGFHLDL